MAVRNQACIACAIPTRCLVDSDEYCMHVPGGGEHGPHAVILSADGQSLIVAAGNHTKLPDAISGSKMPRNWNEDHLLPRRWGRQRPCSRHPGARWLDLQCRPQWKELECDQHGLSQPVRCGPERGRRTLYVRFRYGVGLWCSPWYRPTRDCHATSG